MRKKLILMLLVAVMLTASVVFCSKGVRAEANELSDLIEDTIDSDKNILNELSPVLEKLYEKLLSLFEKIGSLSKDVSRVVKMYNNLDETAEDYPEKLQEFFKAYNELGPVNRKLVDTITGVLSCKEKLLSNLRHIVVTDLYSEQKLETALEGKVTFQSENDSVATVSADGALKTVSVGMAKIEATSDNGETEIFRIFVKKPILSTKVTVKRGNSITISLPNDVEVTEVKVSSTKKISVSRSGLELSVQAIARGNAYIYVGTKAGKTLKYKVQIVK